MVAFGRGVQLAPVGGVHQHVERSRQLEVQRSGTGIDHVACRVRQVPFVQRHTVAVPCSVQARRFNVAVSQGVHDNRHVFAPDVPHGIAGAPVVFKRIQRGCDGRNVPVSRAVGVPLHQHSANGHLRFWFLGQTHPHGVPQSVFKQRANAQGRLDPSVFAIPSLRHPQMKGKRHAFVIHAGHQKAVSLDHDLRVG